jgi:hypothetical protein
MKENDKNIENLIAKMMADQTLESSSIDFTSKIMSQVHAIETSKAKIYKPLISKSAWLVMGCGLLGLSIYALLGNDDLSNLEITKLYSDKVAALFSGMHISKNILYSLLIVPLMVLIQIGVLKNYFDKKYDI